MATSNSSLSLARALIRGFIILNALYGVAIGALLAGTLVQPKFVFRALAGLEDTGVWQLHAGMRSIMVIGLVGAYITYRVLRELLAIVATVRDGDPFVTGNARRLQTIAWYVLAGEGLRLLVGAIVWGASRFLPAIDDIDVGFSFAPWLAVLLLFVLARVFDQGARMRADLDGTV